MYVGKVYLDVYYVTSTLLVPHTIIAHINMQPRGLNFY